MIIAKANILFESTFYKPGDTLPAHDEEMVKAWLEAGTACIKTEEPEKEDKPEEAEEPEKVEEEEKAEKPEKAVKLGRAH